MFMEAGRFEARGFVLLMEYFSWVLASHARAGGLGSTQT